MPSIFTQVSTRCGLPQANAPYGGTAIGNQVMQADNFKICRSITQLIFKWTNVKCNASPSILDAGDQPFTLKAAVRYGGVTYPINFPEGRVATIDPDEIVESLPLNIVVPAGADIQLRWLITYPTNPANWPFAVRYSAGWNQFGTGITDDVDTTATYFTQNGTPVTINPPFQILGNSNYKKSVQIDGDSITVGGDVDAYGVNYGYVQRALVASGIPFVVNGGASGTLANMLETGFGTTPAQKARRRIAHHGDGNISHVFCAIGSADFASGRTDVQVLAYLNQYKAELDVKGIKLVPFAYLPRTNAANNAKADSDSVNVWTYLQNVRDYFVTNNGVGYGVIDANLIARAAGNVNLFRNDLGTPTLDGIHPQAVIHDALTTYTTQSGAAITGIWTP